MLRAQIDRLLRRESACTIVSDSGDVADQGPLDFREFSGRLVLWPLENTLRSSWSFLSALRDGVVPVVVPGRWPASKLARIQESYRNFGMFESTRIRGPENWLSNDGGIFLALMTSGSTGKPQAIATTESRLGRGIEFIHEAQSLSTIESTGILLPISYSYALVNQLLWAAYYERSVYLTSCPLGPFEALRRFAEYGVEMLCFVGSQAGTICELDRDGELSFPRARKVNFAGSPFPMGCFRQLQRLFPAAEFLNNYGCTEAMPRLSVRRVVDPSEDPSHVGRPVGDLKIIIQGEEALGPVMFRGSSTAVGRLSTRGELLRFEEWIPSGDWGEIRDSELYLAGRQDQIVKIEGERFSLLEVESTLVSLGFEHAVAWVESASNRIVAAVCGKSRPNADCIKRTCRDGLAKPAWPKRIYVLDEWPLNASQKTDRAQICEWHEQGRLVERVL